MKTLLRTLLLIGLYVLSVTVQAQDSFNYAYIVQDQRGTQIISIAPHTGEVQGSLNIAANGPIYQAFTSPDGEWVAMLILRTTLREQHLAVVLENIRTGETRDLMSGFIRSEASGIGGSQFVAWSPDSQYLAINMALSGFVDSEIYLYSIALNSTLNLTDDNIHQEQVAWSDNSVRLVTSSSQCSRTSCIHELKTFDISSGASGKTLDLIATSYSLYPPLCELEWSPDENYISFVTQCNSSYIEAPKDVYIWNLEDDTIQPAKQNTTRSFQEQPGRILYGAYDTVWLDNTKFLIGSWGFIQNKMPFAATVIVQPTDQTTRVLAEVGIHEIALHRETGALAFQTFWITESPFGFESVYGPVVITNTSELQQSNLNGVLSGNNIDVAGRRICNPRWSPDGSMLAYTLHKADNCRANLARIVFADNHGRILSENVPQNPTDRRDIILPIGWVVP